VKTKVYRKHEYTISVLKHNLLSNLTNNVIYNIKVHELEKLDRCK